MESGKAFRARVRGLERDAAARGALKRKWPRIEFIVLQPRFIPSRIGLIVLRTRFIPSRIEFIVLKARFIPSRDAFIRSRVE